MFVFIQRLMIKPTYVRFTQSFHLISRGNHLSMEAVVQTPFISGIDTELTLSPGDIITHLIQIDETWWEGQLNGQHGRFRGDIVKFITKESHFLDQEQKMGRKEIKKKCLVKALHNYIPANDDELLLKVNDVIEVIEETEEGWWKGILKGSIGMFPSNFVTVHISDSLEAVKERTEKNCFEKNDGKNSSEFASGLPSDVTETKQKPPPLPSTANMVFMNDSGDRSKTEISSGVKKNAGAPKKPPPPTPTDVSAPRLPPKPVKEQARVSFPYEAQNEDELTIKEGDIITIISKEIEDKGWWRGELNNQIGVFPDNFVKLIKMEEVSGTGKTKTPAMDNNSKHFQETHAMPAQRKPDRPDKPLVTVTAKPNSKPEHSEKIGSSPLLDKKRPKTPPTKPPPPEIYKKEEKPERPVPPHPGKKPQLPPPMKKPLRSSMCSKVAGNVESNCSSVTNSSACSSVVIPALSPSTKSGQHKTENIQDNLEIAVESVFDVVESSVDKLVHLTANRVKVPNKRPPSHIFLKENDKENGVVEGLRWIKQLPIAQTKANFTDREQEPSKVSICSGVEDKPKIPPYRPSPPSTKTSTSKISKQDISSHSITSTTRTINQALSSNPPSFVRLDNDEKSTLDKIFDISKETNVLEAELHEMKTELNFLKESMVSRNEYEYLVKQVTELKESIEIQKNNYNELVSSLKVELEEEKKLRIATQLELEQIKKMPTA